MNLDTLGTTKKSIKQHVENIILFPEAYSIMDIKDAYAKLNLDNRLSFATHHSLGDALRRIYREKKVTNVA